MENYKDILKRNLDEFESEYDMYEDAENDTLDDDFDLLDLDQEDIDGYENIDEYSEDDLYGGLIDIDKPLYGYNEDEWD